MRNLSGSSNHNAELNAMVESYNPIARNLTQEEELSLIKKAQDSQACRINEAANKIASHLVFLVKSIVLNYGLRPEFLAEGFNEAMLVVYKAIMEFDTSRNNRLTSYVVPLIMGALQVLRHDCDLIPLPENQNRLIAKFRKEYQNEEFSLAKFAKKNKISAKMAKTIERLAINGRFYCDFETMEHAVSVDIDPMRDHDLKVMADSLRVALHNVLGGAADSFLLRTQFLDGGGQEMPYEKVACITGKSIMAVQKDNSRAKKILLLPENRPLWKKMQEFYRMVA